MIRQSGAVKSGGPGDPEKEDWGEDWEESAEVVSVPEADSCDIQSCADPFSEPSETYEPKSDLFKALGVFAVLLVGAGALQAEWIGQNEVRDALHSFCSLIQNACKGRSHAQKRPFLMPAVEHLFGKMPRRDVAACSAAAQSSGVMMYRIVLWVATFWWFAKESCSTGGGCELPHLVVTERLFGASWHRFDARFGAGLAGGELCLFAVPNSTDTACHDLQGVALSVMFAIGYAGSALAPPRPQSAPFLSPDPSHPASPVCHHLTAASSNLLSLPAVIFEEFFAFNKAGVALLTAVRCSLPTSLNPYLLAISKQQHPAADAWSCADAGGRCTCY